MNVNINATVLKRASQLLCSNIQQGIHLETTKVRDNGTILEWGLSNGDIIEICTHTDYSTGLPIYPSTCITLMRDDEIIFEEVFFHNQ